MRRLLVRPWTTGVGLALGLILSVALSAPAGAAQATPVVLVGTAPGPIVVAGGTTPVQVAHQALPAGNWTVFAKAELDNTTGDLILLRPVNCALHVGSAFQGSSFTPTGGGADSSKMPLLLTVSAHLSSAGQASLRCDAPGSATGALKLRWLRMVAFRETALSLAANGGSFTTFGNGASLSHAYEVVASAPQTANDTGNYTIVGSIHLPSGNWSITATGTVYAAGSSGTTVSCQLTTGGDFDQTVTTLGPHGSITDRRQVSEQVVHTYASPGTTNFACKPSNPAAGVHLRQVHVTAFKADVLLNQAVGLDDTYPTEPAAVKPLIVAGWDDGPLAVGGVAGFRVVADQELQAGKWVVVAKGVLTHNFAGGALVICRLGTAQSYDTLRLMLAGTGTIDNVQSFAMTWYGSFSSTTEVSLACHTPAGSVEGSWVKVVAYRAGTLQSARLR